MNALDPHHPAPERRPVRIGLIGATPARGWAAMAHVPALRATPKLVLQAVATRSEQTARAAAEAFGAPLAFADARAMIDHEAVDAVVVAVKAPDHFALAEHALQAGKPVFCEWPFGHTIEASRELARLARERNVTTAVGLQGRFSPWLRQIREWVTSGRLGRILSTSLIVNDELSVGSVDQGNAYLLDIANGAHPLTIHSGHYVDALRYALGDVASVAATTAISRPRVVVRQTGETLTATSPDQIAFSGLLDSGALVSYHMRAGTGAPSFLWEIQGEHATLRITSAGYLMWRPLQLELWEPQAKRWTTVPLEPAHEAANPHLPDGAARHVAALYAAFADDILTGSARSVSFAEALRTRETIEAIRAAADDGHTTSPRAGNAAPQHDADREESC